MAKLCASPSLTVDQKHGIKPSLNYCAVAKHNGIDTLPRMAARGQLLLGHNFRRW